MANWQNVQEGLKGGYILGRQTGGRLSSLGKIISSVADRLRQQRETGEEFRQKVNILGVEARIKKLFEPTPEWKPTTKEEALSFEEAKVGLKKGLTLSNALGILSDPFKAQQIKRTYPKLYQEAENVVKNNLGEDVLTKITPEAKIPPKGKGKLPTKVSPILPEENIMDINW